MHEKWRINRLSFSTLPFNIGASAQAIQCSQDGLGFAQEHM